MLKKLIALGISFMLMFSVSQAVFAANEIGINIVGQKEGVVHTPITEDGVLVFPIGEILKFLDLSGTEIVNTRGKPIYSYITFQGQCFKITEGQTDVQEYEVDESGACINATGNTYQLEKSARYLDDPTLGVYVPLSFISKILADAPYGNTFGTKYVDGALEFSMYKEDGTGTKQVINPIKLAMKINSPWLLTEDDGKNFDDNDHNVTPVIRDGSTLLPIAPIIERLGGTPTWTGSEQKVTITLGDNTIELWIDQKTASVNGTKKELAVAPTIINGRTMIPVRFVSENLGATIRWNGDSQIVLIYYGGAEESATDLFSFDYKITMLDAVQKKEDNKKTLEDVVKENQQKHEKVQYNDHDPLDYYGKIIHVGDTVGSGTFDGIVKKINGTKVLVYWNHASFIVEKGKENETAALFGIKWLAEQWVEAKTVTVSTPGY
ncbi:copper amine oxidase N-terminal domain-containing protein [Paenibacillus macerans]|uniref:copper amine oxidase N-terminal domain-containing protein n=1 Tax=Paenibacillus macerans TaxID=44252 RepID=UPI00203D942F|nr:copper amine oxidase N-terminal domain-containing protein [Paenibacillus macerans]MCM3700339.1 copper amine oxidase N-terminal domain-containing protein [Paenibacillus macerans]